MKNKICCILALLLVVSGTACVKRNSDQTKNRKTLNKIEEDVNPPTSSLEDGYDFRTEEMNQLRQTNLALIEKVDLLTKANQELVKAIKEAQSQSAILREELKELRTALAKLKESHTAEKQSLLAELQKARKRIREVEKKLSDGQSSAPQTTSYYGTSQPMVVVPANPRPRRLLFRFCR